MALCKRWNGSKCTYIKRKKSILRKESLLKDPVRFDLKEFAKECLSTREGTI